MDLILSALQRVCDGESLSAETMRNVVVAIMSGECGDVEISAFLVALRMKGEAIDELAGAAQAMRELATPIPTTTTGLLDTCGTGGDQLHTFNISTATAIVLAGAGLPIAKHGNRSVSSSSGSADVLEALGVNLQLTPAQVGRCIDELGLGFCFAPLVHGAMKHVGPIRKRLRLRTIFNLLGPLTNPARADYQLLGAHRPATAEKLALALARMGCRHALAVCGAGELDEIALWGETSVFRVRNGTVQPEIWTPRDLGLPECSAAQLTVNSPAESAWVIRQILAGEPGPARDIVLANAAGGLVAAERVTSPAEGVKVAATAIDTGAAKQVLDRLIHLTGTFQVPAQ